MLSKHERYLVRFENCDYFVELGLHIAFYRKRAGLTQQELADKLCVSRSYVSRIESPNRNQHFSFELFFKLCHILNVPSRCFFEPFPRPDSSRTVAK